MPTPSDHKKLNHLLSINAVSDMTSFSRSTIYRYIAQNKFPAPIKIGSRRVAWKSTDILEWIERLENETSE